MKPYTLGAVAYDPKVRSNWEGFRAFFAARGLPFEFVLFGDYEAQVEAHLRGQLDVAWNSPLAWIETVRARPEAEAIAMRDTDQDLTSVILARVDGPVQVIGDLTGRRVGVGAQDSPQATLIPLGALAEAGVEPQVVHHDVGVGLHGDHIGGEREAVAALLAGTVDAACVIDGNHLAFQRDGTIPRGALRIVVQTGAYDHCNMTVLDGRADRVAQFRELLLSMSYEDPQVRPLLDLEGLRAWRPGRTSGYALLVRAIDRFHTLDAWLARYGA